MNRRDLAKGALSGLALQATPLRAERARGVVEWREILPGIWKGTAGEPEKFSPVRSRLVPPALEGLRKLPRAEAAPLSGVTGEITQRGCLLRLPVQAHELMYGFGLQLLSYQQRSKKKTIRVNADPKNDSGDTHAPVPFYVTTNGYGILVDTFRNVEFYCGQMHGKPSQAERGTGLEVNTPAQMREEDRGESGTVLVEVPRCAGVDIYLFAGPGMLQAVQRYNLFSGGGVMPPEWGLGFWYRPEMHLDADAVLALGEEFRARKIPCDVLGLEPGWQTHAYSCTFVWDERRFPDARGFLDHAGKLGYKVNLWEHAFTHPASPIFEDLRPHAGDFAVWGGLVPDFAGEPARQIFGEYHGKALIDAGVSGFKLDECDNSDFTEGWSFPGMTRFPSGLDGEQMHSVFGLRYQHAIWQQFQQRGQATYSLVRSSGALAAPYPFVLYSDLYDHRQFIRALVNASFSGLLWCPEVRDARSEEDLIRRLQSVVFSPLAMVNAWYIKNPPWKQLDAKRNNAGEAAGDWESLEAKCREIIGWRMSLAPYLLEAFAKYEQDGTPPFRALVLDFPGNVRLSTIDDEYIVGDRMLVAPLFADEPGRTVTLPAGEWHDFWTGTAVRGTFHVPATAKQIPVYVKAGSVVPWASVGQHCADPETRRITARVYGRGDLDWRARDFTLRWDQREGMGNADGATGAKQSYEVTRWERIGGG